LFLGLALNTEGVAGYVLSSLGISAKEIQNQIKSLEFPTDPNFPLDLSPEVKRVLERSVYHARQMRHHYIGTEHILLGLIDTWQGMPSFLIPLGISPQVIRERTVETIRKSPSLPRLSQSTASSGNDRIDGGFVAAMIIGILILALWLILIFWVTRASLPLL
jgi:ATP-dependent Clp protease ATP-binding subunit ClpA